MSQRDRLVVSLESHSHIIFIQFGLAFQCRSTLNINLVLFILFAEQNISHLNDCTCGFIFIKPDTLIGWELITTNDNTCSMVN